MNALAAVLFTVMAILFLGIAVATDLTLAWVFTLFNLALAGLNLMLYRGKAQQ